MFIKLDKDVKELLCCAFCNGEIKEKELEFVCDDCGTQYPAKRISVGEREEQVYDFRIHRPQYCNPSENVKWEQVQHEYEQYSKKIRIIDDLGTYLDEIDCVQEIYRQEFHIEGSVLDVGGNQGKLRHFLSETKIPLYVSVDPYFETLEDIRHRPNLLKAYPCMKEPCNFFACHAENLPFHRNTFDWVHMRSVLDHFQDPYQSVKDAYRVLKADGTLLIGLSVRGGKSSLKTDNEASVGSRTFLMRVRRMFQRAGIKGLVKAAIYHIKRTEKRTDDHMFHWNYEDLIDLLRITGFEVIKEHWQKPPFTMCIYLSAKKRERTAQ